MDITQYTTFDLPVPYKDLNIYPVKMKDYFVFNYFAQSITFEKNYIPDPKIITMTNLEYMYHISSEDFEKNPQLLWFDRLLSMVLIEDESFKEFEKSISRYKYDDKGKPFFEIGNIHYNSSDYENIKRIVAEQNMVELPDERISKDVRDSLEKAREYKNKITGNKPATIEDYIVSISSVTGWSMEYIYEMPIRKFIKAIRRYDGLIHYEIYLSASMSGMVEFKDKSFIKHWLSNLEDDDKWSDVSIDLETVKGKVSLESAKKK